ncbi:Uncharacterized protein FWK35_00023702 [Aphis craccivora]|uniref:Uncharacterized protein n=1 Tax=Aphis craccivora TaxID=307492 RepID=A0A6G0YKR6_APHCR|nr:Uncharacterized protein FWK35_00023702 [Aphis craccivora]
MFCSKIAGLTYKQIKHCLRPSKNSARNFLDFERSDECIDFTVIITYRNNAPFSNFEGGLFRRPSEYPWYTIEVKIIAFLLALGPSDLFS